MDMDMDADDVVKEKGAVFLKSVLKFFEMI